MRRLLPPPARHRHDIALRIDDRLDQVCQLFQGFGLFITVMVSVIDALDTGDGMTEHAFGDIPSHTYISEHAVRRQSVSAFTLTGHSARAWIENCQIPQRVDEEPRRLVTGTNPKVPTLHA